MLADLERTGTDQIVCLGDVATLGPRPGEVIERLRELGCACILGNHDEFMLDLELVRAYSNVPVIVDSVAWTRDQLTAEQLAFIGSFQGTLDLAVGANTRLFLFHGTPESNVTDLLATTPPEVVDDMLAGHAATIMAGGHTHIQMLRQHRGILLVNPGSVGIPFEEYVNRREPQALPHAEYAIVECQGGDVSVQLRRVMLDKAALHDAALSVSNPLSASLAAMYR
ncbi:MAG: metallophosphoesterase family protein [Polyangiaceae bacterium]